MPEHCLPWNELLREGNAWQLFSTKKAATDGLIGKIGEVGSVVRFIEAVSGGVAQFAPEGPLPHISEAFRRVEIEGIGSLLD